MNLKNKPPVFVPDEFRSEIEKLSKAALMDMVWDYAMQIGVAESLAATGKSVVGDSQEARDVAMKEFRRLREIILTHRKQAR